MTPTWGDDPIWPAYCSEGWSHQLVENFAWNLLNVRDSEIGEISAEEWERTLLAALMDAVTWYGKELRPFQKSQASPPNCWGEFAEKGFHAFSTCYWCLPEGIWSGKCVCSDNNSFVVLYQWQTHSCWSFWKTAGSWLFELLISPAFCRFDYQWTRFQYDEI